MRIKTLIIITLTAATLSVLALAAISLSTSHLLTELSRVENQTQAAAHEVTTLLVLTHEYALHTEPRAAYQWQKNIDSLLRSLAVQKTMPAEATEQALALRELFAQLVSSSSSADVRLKGQRNEILLDQLLSNTQALSDRFHSLNMETSAKRDDAEYIFHLTALAIPVISLLALLLTFALLALRVLRPLGVMRKAVEAVALGDLSERHLIEDNLQLLVDERTASLDAIVETAADGIMTTDETGSVLSLNQAAEQIFGYKAGEVIGHNVSMLMPKPYQGAHGGHMRNYLETGQSNIIGKGREVVGLHKDGHQFPIYIAISEVRLANERRFTGIMRDISEQKQTERELITARDEAERANQAKSEFLSSMSHELRTPMNAILGYSQLMQYDDTLPAAHKDNVQEILKAGYHLLELINEVLDLARVESGHIDLSLEPVLVCPVIEECLHLVLTLAKKRNIRITHSGAKELAVQADRTRLKQVLLNLLSNAIKYNREGGSVHLDVTPQGADRLRIQVRDSGHGIAAGHLTELFQPFNRLDAGISDIEGTGIGLTITRRIVELMGGSVDVTSEVGVGSTFWIELPLTAATENVLAHSQKEVADHSEVSAAAHDKVQYTLLYIEDNPANLRLVAQIIGQRKFTHLITAHSPEFGIELAQAHHPDLILLDINMPDMNGYQVLEVLKASPGLQSIPVIAITANAMDRDIERGKAAGFKDYVTKPIDMIKFHALLDKYLVANTNAGREFRGF